MKRRETILEHSVSVYGEECMPLSLYRNVCLLHDDVILSHIVRQQTDNYWILRIIAVRAARPFAREEYE